MIKQSRSYLFALFLLLSLSSCGMNLGRYTNYRSYEEMGSYNMGDSYEMINLKLNKSPRFDSFVVLKNSSEKYHYMIVRKFAFQG